MLKIKTFLLGIAALLFCAELSAQVPDTSIPYYEPSDTILILGAVPQEIPEVIAQMQGVEKSELWGIPYWSGTLHNKPVVIAITGVGKTFAAMTTTLFITEFKPRLLVMTGTGARINPELRTGDVIIATHTYEHDYGSLTPEGMVYRDMFGPVDGADVVNEFTPTEEWLAKADAAAAEYPTQTVTANGATYETSVRRGVVSSSDLFGVTEQRIQTLRSRFNTDIMEMESAPFGLVSEFFGIPFLVIRAGSNVAQEAPNNDYLVLGPIAAKEAAKFTAHLVKYLEREHPL